jgi:putative glycosyltransferase (exosortase G-associated)
MTADTWFTSIFFWGVWLVLPIMVDGSVSFAYLIAAISGRARRIPIRPISHAPNGKWPRVTVMIPVYNSAEILGRCIGSIKAQSYPQDLIQILAIDNGSKDNSYKIFCEEQQKDWPGSIHWLSTFHNGKTWALNVGIHYAQTPYIINLDSDVTLHRDAIANMVAAFENDENLICATGAVEIEPIRKEHGFMRILHECEFQEYYFSFNVGRRFQAESGALFTLAGAFSAFRREALLGTFMYDASTVGEDTFMTFEMHERFPGKRVGVITSAVCYTEPIPSLKALYSQRTRWQRGEIEVIAAHPKLARRGIFYRGFSPVRTLVVDHTLAFPRVAWTFLLPSLAFFGYHWTTLAVATAVLYAAYMAIEGATWITNALLVVEPSRSRLWNGWWVIPIMPAYRYMTFWMRFAGVLTVLTEAHQWRTEDPVSATRKHALHLVGKVHTHPHESRAA